MAGAEDGEQVTSAIIEIVDKPLSDNADNTDNKLSRHKKLFINAWEKCGMETRAGQPYLSRSGFIQYLIDTLELTESSANLYSRPAAKGKPICDLLVGQIIDQHEHGWIVLDAVMASAMLIRAS